MRPTLPLLLLPLVLAACANPEVKAAREAELRALAAKAEATGKDDACAWANPLYDWQVVDEKRLILRVNEGRYLVRFGGFCEAELRDGITVGVQSTSGSICPSDRVFIEGKPCIIRQMWKVPEEKAVVEAPR